MESVLFGWPFLPPSLSLGVRHLSSWLGGGGHAGSRSFRWLVCLRGSSSASVGPSRRQHPSFPRRWEVRPSFPSTPRATCLTRRSSERRFAPTPSLLSPSPSLSFRPLGTARHAPFASTRPHRVLDPLRLRLHLGGLVYVGSGVRAASPSFRSRHPRLAQGGRFYFLALFARLRCLGSIRRLLPAFAPVRLGGSWSLGLPVAVVLLPCILSLHPPYPQCLTTRSSEQRPAGTLFLLSVSCVASLCR